MGMTHSDAGKIGYIKSKAHITAWIAELKRRAMERYAGRRCLSCLELLPYEKRYSKHCDHSCAGTEVNKPRRKHRKCKNCSQLLSAQQNLYCSQSCHLEVMYRDYIRRWLIGEVSGGNWHGVSNYVRRWLIQKRGRRCESCGWEKVNPITGLVPIQVNHKDGNPERHRPENLELLCPNCHSLTPSFGGLNRGRGRSARRKRLPSTTGSAAVS